MPTITNQSVDSFVSVKKNRPYLLWNKKSMSIKPKNLIILFPPCTQFLSALSKNTNGRNKLIEKCWLPNLKNVLGYDTTTVN